MYPCSSLPTEFRGDCVKTRTSCNLAVVTGGLFAGALTFAAAASAEGQTAELPRWEAGIGLVTLYAPDYRGADQMRGLVFPLPYLVYRGDWLRADREGVRAEFLQREDIQFNFSASFGLPVDSDGSDARRGMPDIDWVLEIGPAMSVNLARWNEGQGELDLRLPVRAALALDDGPEYAGAVFAPNLRATFRDVRWAGGAQLRLSTGPLWATGEYHRFYYGVEPQFATDARPAYRPAAGYSGWDFSTSAVKFVGNWRLFAFAGFDLLYGAEFEDSPLIRKRANWSAGAGLAYVFFQSDQTVRARE